MRILILSSRLGSFEHTIVSSSQPRKENLKVSVTSAILEMVRGTKLNSLGEKRVGEKSEPKS